MAILRHAPGESTPEAGIYTLVGHYGEPLGFAQWFSKGERLPSMPVAADEPVWYVLTDTSTRDAQAA